MSNKAGICYKLNGKRKQKPSYPQGFQQKMLIMLTTREYTDLEL